MICSEPGCSNLGVWHDYHDFRTTYLCDKHGATMPFGDDDFSGTYKPVPDSEHDFICRCGEIVKHSDTVEVTHDTGTTKTLIRLCRDCAGQRLCKATYTGVHSAVWTAADDPEEWRTWNCAEALPGPVPNDYQYGVCSACFEPMRWDVDRQRWVDLTMIGLAKAWLGEPR